MAAKSKNPRRLDKGGFANADIPQGFERMREPHEDAPLTRGGRIVYYTILAIIIFGVVTLILLASIERQ